MNEPHDPNRTVDVPSATPDALDAGLAAGFGRPADGPPSVLAGLRESLGDLRPPLLKEAEGESAHVVRPKSDAMPPVGQAGDRYQLQGEIARGGMGAVLRGRDVDLGRDLAVKVLLERHARRPEVARRFVEEAQINGQLQHPGVVPVYDIGRFGELPFFTMKLVKGQTLAQLLGEREGPAADRPSFLSIALKVAETLAYAHAKGVIHRDLKPANVMVGSFGEVQVMDWGLAKVLAEGGLADEVRASRAHQEPEDITTIRTARSTGSTGSFGTVTEAGSLLGTPAYMPPEQANGDIANLDRRVDVFGLGAILCEVLTGKPPYVGRSPEEVRRKACNGDLADATARLGGCGADAELIALTTACLSPEAIDRPKDAQAVADGLSAYLNGVQERLQAAERERAVAVAREAEQRKKRKVQLALAAAVALLLLGGGAFGWWHSEQAAERRLADERAATEMARLEGERKAERGQREVEDAARRGRNAEAVAALLGQSEEALKAGDAAKAAVALEAAKKRATEGGAEKEAERLGRLDADLTLLRDLDDIDQRRWNFYARLDESELATRTQGALARFGADTDAVSVDEAAARVSASMVRERVVWALDRLLWLRKAAGARALLRRVDGDPYRDAIRDTVLAGDEAKLLALARQKPALELPAAFAAFLGEHRGVPVERRRQLLQAAVSQHPRDLTLLMAMAWTYSPFPGQGSDEQLRWLQAAIAADPNNYAAYFNLGITLHNHKRDYDGAIACFKKAIELDPKMIIARANLGVALSSKGDLDEAIACFRKVIELEPKRGLAHVQLGDALHRKGDLEGASACFRKAIELEPKFANAHYALGTALLGKGDVDGAITCFRKAIEIDPKYPEAHCNLGHALEIRGQFAEALAAYRRGHELGTKQPDWRYPSAAWVRTAEAEVAIEAKLPAFLKGELQPAGNEERLVLILVCRAKKLHHTAAALASAAFAADPTLAADPRAGHRYNAACDAALAAAGEGEDAAKLDDKEKARLRKQALDWLRADLVLLGKQLETDKSADRVAVQRVMQHWQQDRDLAGLRDAAALAKLPPEQRAACEQLWADVVALLKKAGEETK